MSYSIPIRILSTALFTLLASCFGSDRSIATATDKPLSAQVVAQFLPSAWTDGLRIETDNEHQIVRLVDFEGQDVEIRVFPVENSAAVVEIGPIPEIYLMPVTYGYLRPTQNSPAFYYATAGFRYGPETSDFRLAVASLDDVSHSKKTFGVPLREPRSIEAVQLGYERLIATGLEPFEPFEEFNR